MRKIDSAWKGLYEGYLGIRKAQRQLQLEWTRAIQVAEKRIHQRQYRGWQAKVAVQHKYYLGMKILLPMAVLVLFACSLFSSILPLLILPWGAAVFFSLVLVGLLIVQKVVINNLEKRPPIKLTGGQKLLNIVEPWWNRLKPPPIEIRRDGDEGEKALLDALESRLSNRYIALHQYMVRQNLDADVLVLGPPGIWLLESKFNSGKIICRNGMWSQEKHYFAPGGEPKTDYIDKKSYDKQWLAERQSIIQTIQRRLPQNMHWVIDEIRGGLVFTLDNVTLEIDQSCQVEYGRIRYWVDKIAGSPVVPNLTTEILLCIIDAVLEHGNEISPGTSHKSARQQAMDLYAKAATDIPVFVRTNL